MNGPAVIPGKRFNPWRFVMRSIFVNRFYLIAMWYWFSGMAMAYGGATHNFYLFVASIFAVMAGTFPVSDWEAERELQADLPAKIVEELDRAAEAMEREKASAYAAVRQIARRASTP